MGGWLAALLGLGCAPSPAGSPHVRPTKAPQPSATTQAAHPLDDATSNAVYFSPNDLPPTLVDQMARQRVVMLGEHHGYREHHDFLLNVVRRLHARGARWLLLEGYQSESWAADSYVAGRIDRLSASTAKYFGYTLDHLRAFNRPLAPDERVRVAFIDIDHRPWALPAAIDGLRKHVSNHGCLDRFLAAIDWDTKEAPEVMAERFSEAHLPTTEELHPHFEQLQRELEDGSCAPEANRALKEMVAVARKSLHIRQVWDTDGEHAAHPAREEAIKAMVDRRLKGSRGPVIINMGGFHLQKTHVMGTPKVWLGEHLANPEHPVGGAVLRLYVQFARAERRRGHETYWWSIDVPKNGDELLGHLHRRAGTRAAFLSLDHPRFAEHKVPVSYMYQVVEHAPGTTFDGFILLPEGHRLY